MGFDYRDGSGERFAGVTVLLQLRGESVQKKVFICRTAYAGFSRSSFDLLPDVTHIRFESADESADCRYVVVGEIVEKLVLQRIYDFPELVDGRLAFLGQADEIFTTIRTVFGSLNQSLVDKGIKQAHERCPFYTDRCCQVLLLALVSEDMEMQEWAPGSLSQAGIVKLMVDDLTTAPCQKGETENEVISVNLGIGWHYGAFSGFRTLALKYGMLLINAKAA